MLTWGQVAAFGAACVILIAVPGPSVLFIVGRTIALGRRAALATVAGNAIGTYSLGVIVALGVGPMIQRFPIYLSIIKLFGAAFLCWLGVQAIRHRNDNLPASVAVSTVRRQATLIAMRQGFVVGVSNPKALVVFAVIMPPFLNEAAPPLILQMVFLAFVPVTIGLLSDSAWAISSDLARRWLSGSDARLRALSAVGGGMMIGLGLLMAAS